MSPEDRFYGIMHNIAYVKVGSWGYNLQLVLRDLSHIRRDLHGGSSNRVGQHRVCHGHSEIHVLLKLALITAVHLEACRKQQPIHKLGPMSCRMHGQNTCTSCTTAAYLDPGELRQDVQSPYM